MSAIVLDKVTNFALRNEIVQSKTMLRQSLATPAPFGIALRIFSY